MNSARDVAIGQQAGFHHRSSRIVTGSSTIAAFMYGFTPVCVLRRHHGHRRIGTRLSRRSNNNACQDCRMLNNL